MKIVGLDINGNVVEIRGYDLAAPVVRIIEAPDDCEIGSQLVNDTWMPKPKTLNEKKIDALVKAVLTGDLTDLQALQM